MKRFVAAWTSLLVALIVRRTLWFTIGCLSIFSSARKPTRPCRYFFIAYFTLNLAEQEVYTVAEIRKEISGEIGYVTHYIRLI